MFGRKQLTCQPCLILPLLSHWIERGLGLALGGGQQLGHNLSLGEREGESQIIAFLISLEYKDLGLFLRPLVSVSSFVLSCPVTLLFPWEQWYTIYFGGGAESTQ